MRESVSAACIKSYDKAEKGTLSPLKCLSFANTIQADLPTCDLYIVGFKTTRTVVWCADHTALCGRTRTQG